MTDRPWLTLYEEGVPASVDWPRARLDELLYRTALEYPNRAALAFFDRTISYTDLDIAVDRFSAGLQRLGVEPGDRVSVMMPNCPQLVIAYEAVWRCGGVVVPSNPLYTAAEFAHQAADAGSTVAIVLSSLYELVEAARQETPIEHVVVANIKDYFTGPMKALFTLFRERKDGHRATLHDDGAGHWWHDIEVDDRPEPVSVDAGSPAVFMYTGGTTGVPKAAVLSHDNLNANAHQVMSFVPQLRHGREVVLTALPLTHAYAITVGLNLAVAGAFTQVLVPDPRDLGGLLAAIDKHKPTVLPGVPTLYAAIARHRHVKSGKYDVSSIEYCISGAAPLPPDVHREFTEVTGAHLVEGYGLSEASPVTHCNPVHGGDEVGTIGVPLPGTDAIIVDEDQERTVLGPGKRGILCVAGPQVMSGYWKRDDETKHTMHTDEAGTTWLHTGDVATMDASGRFRIVDRKKDMILGSGGLNVYPREIEDVLHEHPAVAGAGVVGVPPGAVNQRAMAFVVLAPGATVTEDELIAFCRERLARYKVPREIEFRDELPTSFVGKVVRRRLLEDETGP